MVEVPSEKVVAAQKPIPAAVSATDNDNVLAQALAAVSSVDGPTPAGQEEAPSGERVNTITPGEHAKTSVHTKVIVPINDITRPDNKLETLLAKEEANESAAKNTASTTAPVINDVRPPTSQDVDEAIAPEPKTVIPTNPDPNPIP